MKVVITAGTEFAGEEQTDGGIAGLATFKASGAITDHGTDTTYDATRRPVRPRWWIESATGTYKGLQGRGNESENASYTVSTLTGKVWR